MLDLVRWYVVIQLIGIAALPIAARFFGGLPDRGYAFARPLGLLVVGVLLWFGAIFGFWTNTGAMIAVLVVVVALVGWLGLPDAVATVKGLWKDRRSHIYVVEGLFVAAFVFWAFCRSFFPEIEATEKPMDFMFLNAILRSPHFPPIDPWLSGNSISYYYLGYLLMAVLTELSGVVPSVAFNLALATLFALTATGAFALAHALVEGLRQTLAVSAGQLREDLTRWPSWLGGFAGAFLVTFIGNWEGFLELLHAHGIGSAGFWQWIAIIGLDHPYQSTQWYPNDAQDNWWWFRASRVITDYAFGTPLPKSYNTINEFPFFSFLLGDMHPHVMALPFAFVCLGYALSFLRSSAELRLDQLESWIWDFVFIAFLFGSLFLLNAWDILTYLFVLVCAFAVRSYFSRPRFDLDWLRRCVVFGAVALGASILLYWPFYVTFRSQASGLLGIVEIHSHLRHFVIFWGPFLFLAGSLVIAELALGLSPLPRGAVGQAGPAWTRSPITWIVVALVAVGSLLARAPALAVVVPLLVGALALVLRYLAGSDVVGTVLATRTHEGRAGGRARDVDYEGKRAEIAGGAVPASWAPEHIYIFVLLFVSVLLLLGTELVFIDDSFHDRMNTVFKLYYQAWVMLAIVGAYTLYYLGGRWLGVVNGAREVGTARAAQHAAVRRSSEYITGSSRARLGAGAWLSLASILVGASFVYVPAALESRSQGFGTVPTLDGLAYYASISPDDAAGIAWLQQHVSGTPVVVEATGGSYSANGEVAWMTGLPTVLGWNFHEIQWRGPGIIPVENQRKADLDTIYRTTDRNVALGLLKKYQASYVYVGPLERAAYPNDQAGLDKFGTFMDIVYQNPGVTIYKVRGGDS